ncbi:MAG: hypothetical protein PVF83_06475 [Anaerolineales bacterium]|jgi:hypothetical protein
MKTIRCIGAAFLLLVGTTMCMLVVGVFALGVEDYALTPRLVSGLSFSDPPAEAYTYSPEQMDWAEQAPEGFYILFFNREAPNGDIEEVRYEEWVYYSEGIKLVFENGELLSQETIPPETVIPSPYTPAQFSAFMTREEIASSLDLEEWLIVPVDKVIVEKAQIYFADQLTFGLQDEELIYVESLAVEE